jgi:hypothetical protein
MDTTYHNITDFFQEIFNDLECHSDTRAYIVGIYGKYQHTNFDLSKDSITLLFSQARQKQDFSIYQNIGDWIFFANTWAPKHLKFASKEYYDTIGRLSYYSCYKLINKKWKLFEELADDFIKLEHQVEKKLQLINT